MGDPGQRRQAAIADVGIVPNDLPLVVFDGMCVLCSRVVQFVVRHDRDSQIRFLPLQTPLGTKLLEEHGIDPSDAKTFLFIEQGNALRRSDAALAIAAYLPRWRWVRGFRFVPRFIRDGVYSVIARYRYRWFGRRETCLVPDGSLAERFIDGNV